MGDPGVNSVSTVCYIKRISLHMYNMYMFSVSTVQLYTLKWSMSSNHDNGNFKENKQLLRYHFAITACASQSLGVSDKSKVPDAQMSGYLTYSSYLESNGRYGSSGYGWVGSNSNSWLQVDLGNQSPKQSIFWLTLVNMMIMLAEYHHSPPHAINWF